MSSTTHIQTTITTLVIGVFRAELLNWKSAEGRFTARFGMSGLCGMEQVDRKNAQGREHLHYARASGAINRRTVSPFKS